MTGLNACSSLFAQMSTSYSLIPLYSDVRATLSRAMVPSFPALRPRRQNSSGHLGVLESLQYVQSCSPITSTCFINSYNSFISFYLVFRNFRLRQTVVLHTACQGLHLSQEIIILNSGEIIGCGSIRIGTGEVHGTVFFYDLHDVCFLSSTFP